MTATEQELTKLEHAWMEAVQRKDIEALERILAPEYAYTASGQGRWSRQGWLETVAVYDIHRFEFVEVDVRPYGDVAVVLSRYRQDASVGGAPRSGEFLFTDVWVRRDGSWQVDARSSILMPEVKGVSVGRAIPADPTEATKALVRRFIEDGLNGGDLAVIAEVVADDFVAHPLPPGQAPGRAGVTQFAAEQRAAAPDWRITIADIIAEGDRVAVRATGRGTPTRAYFGLPAPGRRLEVSWIAIYRVAGGKIAERWTEADWLGVLRQAGVVEDAIGSGG